MPGHTEEEVRRILLTFEQLYHGQFPHLQLHRWAKTIFAWLINPILDSDATGRVTMDHLSKLVVTSVKRAYEQGATDLDAATLQTVAEEMILRRDDITSLDEPRDGKETEECHK